MSQKSLLEEVEKGEVLNIPEENLFQIIVELERICIGK